ncbi:helix-turn-helix domain-containing protein [Robbsia sp. KACC 23696]|uniref:GlxA family transcriptional regulator n=1 Tax=Robbsia sp. KACC 23696 TaxID=3149231 RepID=UPI00325B61DB
MLKALSMQRVWFVIPPRVHILDLAGPLQVLNGVNEFGIAPLVLRAVGPEIQPDSFQGVRLTDVQPLPLRMTPGDVVMVLGCKLNEGALPTVQQRQVVDWLRDVVAPARAQVTIASVCTGAVLLAEAGLLDGRDCTTHHAYLDRMRQRYPAARVLSKRMLVDDGDLVSSAGVSAGIDLALHLVARAFGSAAAIRIARDNLVPFRRLEHDPALAAPLRHREHDIAVVHAIQDHLSANPAFAEPYDALAGRFGLSYRHTARLFQQAAGVTLKLYHQQLRIGQAELLLRDSDLAVAQIAERCGFGTPQAFRAAWRQQHALAPMVWRAHTAGTRSCVPAQSGSAIL